MPTITLGQQVSLIARPKPTHQYAVLHMNSAIPPKAWVRFNGRIIGTVELSRNQPPAGWALLTFNRPPAELSLCSRG